MKDTDALSDALGLGSRVGNITLGNADAVGFEELSGAVLVDGEVASLLHDRRILCGQSGQSRRPPGWRIGVPGQTLTALSAEAACLLRASLNMADL